MNNVSKAGTFSIGKAKMWLHCRSYLTVGPILQSLYQQDCLAFQEQTPVHLTFASVYMLHFLLSKVPSSQQKFYPCFKAQLRYRRLPLSQQLSELSVHQSPVGAKLYPLLVLTRVIYVVLMLNPGYTLPNCASLCHPKKCHLHIALQNSQDII